MPIAHFEKPGVLGEWRRWQLDADAQFRGAKGVVPLRLVAGQADELPDGNGAPAGGSVYVHGGVEDRDARVTGAEDGVLAVEAVARRTAGSRRAFVALLEGGLHEVRAPSALQQVSAGGGPHFACSGSLDDVVGDRLVGKQIDITD